MHNKLVTATVLCGAVLCCGNHAPAAGEQTADREKEIEKALGKEISLQFVDQPTNECFMYFRGLTDIKVIIDPACKETDQTLVTLQLRRATLRDALAWICELSGRQYELRDGAIYLGSLPASTSKLKRSDIGPAA